MNSISGDFKIRNIFSGTIVDLDSEIDIKNISLNEPLYCLECNTKLEKFHNYELPMFGMRFLLDMHICNKCKIAYELSYRYSNELVSLKSYIKRNKLIQHNNSNNIQLIN
jgi:hypothetical protein